MVRQAILGVHTRGAVIQACVRCPVVSKGQVEKDLQEEGEGAMKIAIGGVGRAGTRSNAIGKGAEMLSRDAGTPHPALILIWTGTRSRHSPQNQRQATGLGACPGLRVEATQGGGLLQAHHRRIH